MLYLLLASGTAGTNQYGPVHYSTFIEKLMAWLILIAILISLISTAGFFTTSLVPILFKPRHKSYKRNGILLIKNTLLFR